MREYTRVVAIGVLEVGVGGPALEVMPYACEHGGVLHLLLNGCALVQIMLKMLTGNRREC